MDRKINPTDREIRSLEKAAECPVGIFALLSEIFNPLDVSFKFHISESRPARLNRRAAFSYVRLSDLGKSLEPI